MATYLDGLARTSFVTPFRVGDVSALVVEGGDVVDVVPSSALLLRNNSFSNSEVSKFGIQV
jgi:hypothetical protein